MASLSSSASEADRVSAEILFGSGFFGGLMKNIATDQEDPALEALGQDNLSYKLSDYYLEVELRDTDESPYRANLYLWSSPKEYLEVRFCLGTILDPLFQAATRDAHVARLFKLYPLLYEKLIKNPATGSLGEGVLKRAIDPDDGDAKWFIVYRIENLADLNLSDTRNTLLDPRLTEALNHTRQNLMVFMADLDLSRISPWHQIWRGAKKGLARGLPFGILRAIGIEVDEDVIDAVLPEEVSEITLNQLQAKVSNPETFERLNGKIRSGG